MFPALNVLSGRTWHMLAMSQLKLFHKCFRKRKQMLLFLKVKLHDTLAQIITAI